VTSTSELTDLVQHLRLHDHQKRRWIEVVDAVVEPPVMTLTMDGASTLDVKVNDHDRTLLRSTLLQHRCWAEVDDIRFELVAINKTGNVLALTFEDGIAAALRRVKSPLSVPAGTTTRADFAVRLAKEARVPYLVDDTPRPKVSSQLTRSAHGEKSDSWEVLGDTAEAVHWRRFSDGRHLIFGGDEWLLDRDTDPLEVREYSGPVAGEIGLDLDVAKRASGATFDVDARLWAARPGTVVTMGDDMGPGAGKWLVSQFTRPLTSTRASVTLVRERHSLKEPKKRNPVGDPGDPNYVPGQGGTPGGPDTGSSGRARMVAWALAHTNCAYVYGATGPDAYDCSGFTQAASRAGGRTLPRTAAEQSVAADRITVDAALGIRGALLFRIGVAEYNHVAISLGNGSTVEARGSAYGCGVFGGAASGGWTSGGIWL
jgi:cell wall-associated NlpC family hydrolase